ncbi:MAG: ribonuclease P protein component [Cyanobium sp.]
MALPRRHRIRGQRPFDRLHRKGRRFQSALISLRVVEALPALLPPGERHQSASPWRCAVAVSSKVSKRAVRRNRLRRLLHNHLRRCDPAPPRPHWLLLSLRVGAAEAEPGRLLEECTDLLRQAGLIP